MTGKRIDLAEPVVFIPDDLSARHEKKTADRDEKPIRRNREKQKPQSFWTPTHIGLVAVGGIAVVGIALFLVMTLLKKRDASETWAHTELTAFLNGKGLSLEQADSTGVSQNPSVTYKSAKYPFDIRRSEAMLDPENYIKRRYVFCTKYATAEEAKDRAGALGTDGFSWGRFVFMGGRDGLLADIRSAIAQR